MTDRRQVGRLGAEIERFAGLGAAMMKEAATITGHHRVADLGHGVDAMSMTPGEKAAQRVGSTIDRSGRPVVHS